MSNNFYVFVCLGGSCVMYVLTIVCVCVCVCVCMMCLLVVIIYSPCSLTLYKPQSDVEYLYEENNYGYN